MGSPIRAITGHIRYVRCSVARVGGCGPGWAETGEGIGTAGGYRDGPVADGYWWPTVAWAPTGAGGGWLRTLMWHYAFLRIRIVT